MAKYLLALALSIAFVTQVNGLGFDSLLGGADEDQDQEGRLILPIIFAGQGTNGNVAPLNITNALLALLALAAAALLPLLGLAALGLLLWALLSQNDHGGYGGGGYGSHSSYSGSYRRSFDPTQTDWEQLSILDWINIAHDAYSNFDPTDMDCQKKIICEVHQNMEKFGPVTKTLTKWFSYLQYAEVMALPYEIKALIEDFLDAAQQGKTLKKDCSEIFSHCAFSVKSVMEKYRPHLSYITTNEVK